MEIAKNTRLIIAIGGVLLLVAIVYGIPLALNAVEPQVCTVNGQCEHEIFANNLIKSVPLVLLAGMGIGAAAFYFFSERRQQIPAAKPVNREAVYKLLDSDERKIVAKLVENKGKALQSELSYLEGVGKVKAHRLIEKMAGKGIIEKEAFGKTNQVKLSKELQELLI